MILQFILVCGRALHRAPRPSRASLCRASRALFAGVLALQEEQPKTARASPSRARARTACGAPRDCRPRSQVVDAVLLPLAKLDVAGLGAPQSEAPPLPPKPRRPLAEARAAPCAFTTRRLYSIKSAP